MDNVYLLLVEVVYADFPTHTYSRCYVPYFPLDHDQGTEPDSVAWNVLTANCPEWPLKSIHIVEMMPYPDRSSMLHDIDRLTEALNSELLGTAKGVIIAIR